MAFELVDDAEVFEAALSFLDLPSVLDGQQDGGHDDVDAAHPASKGAVSNVNSRTGATKKRRTYNPNRAREVQRSELLALREQVPAMEKRLNVLQAAALARRRDAISAGTDKLEGSWRKLALHQLQTRVNAEAEKARLGDLVREHAAITTQCVQELVQQGQQLQVMGPFLPRLRSFKRLYFVPLVRSDAADFQEMVASIDEVYQEVLEVFNSEFDTETSHGLKDAQYRMLAEKTVPSDWLPAGAAAWRYFAHSSGRKTSRFHNRTSPYQNMGLVADDMVIENFGVEQRQETIRSDWKTKQVFSRYVTADRVVIAWWTYINPSSFKGEVVSGVCFKEKGAFVIESGSKRQTLLGPHKPTALVRSWQVLTPQLPASEWIEQGKYTHELTEFVAKSLQSCQLVALTAIAVQPDSVVRAFAPVVDPPDTTPNSAEPLLPP